MTEALWVLIGTVLGAAITIIPSIFERKDKLRLLTFEKRLETHQKAYALCQQLYAARLDKVQVLALARQIDRWWNENSFYLDEVSRMRLLDLIQAAMDFPDTLAFKKLYAEASVLLQNGIGHKHLEKTSEMSLYE